MKNCLIGYTGLIGKNLLEKYDIKYLFNSKNINNICENEYDIVFCAAPSAVKWKANKDPEEDLEQIFNIIKNIKNIKTKKFVLFSTVDVYGTFPNNENNLPFIQNACFYGKNRIIFEDYVSNFFENHHIIRLPGLFGKFLKKNIIFDLLNNNIIQNINSDDVYQWFYLDDLAQIIDFCINNNIKIFNVATEPLSNLELIQNIFPEKINLLQNKKNLFYNMTTKYYENGYIYSKKEILEKLKYYVHTFSI